MNIVNKINLPEASGGYSNSKMIRTTNGVFHTGMTLEEARLLGRDKCVLRRSFDKVDKNKDEILTNDEILAERDREAKMFGWDAVFMGAFAVLNIALLFKRFNIFDVLFGGLFTTFAIDSISRKSKLKNVNEELKQQLYVNA